MILAQLANIARFAGDPKIIKTGPSSLTSVDTLAKSLAWFGIALGAIELLEAKRLGRFLGVAGPTPRAIIRLFGVREIAAGIMTLSSEKKLGLWARTAGDGLDTMALLAALQTSRRPQNVKLALAAVLGAAALDAYAAARVTTRAARKASPRNYSDRSGFPRGLDLTRSRSAIKAKEIPFRTHSKQAF